MKNIKNKIIPRNINAFYILKDGTITYYLGKTKEVLLIINMVDLGSIVVNRGFNRLINQSTLKKLKKYPTFKTTQFEITNGTKFEIPIKRKVFGKRNN